jgi:hypothetical protein
VRRGLPLLERALFIWEKAHGPGHPHTKIASGNLTALQSGSTL